MTEHSSRLKGIHLIINECDWSNSIEAKIEDMIRGGIRVFQFRFSKAFLLNLERIEIQNILLKIKEANAIALLNNHWQLVQKYNFDGAHIGQSDGDPFLIKSFLKKKILGISCYGHLGLAYSAKKTGCDYVSFGAYARSKTKENAKVLSNEQLEIILTFKELPTVLIGGIHSDNLTSNIALNFDMIAISNGILGALDPKQALQEVMNIIKK